MITILLVLFAGIFNSISDTLRYRFNRSLFYRFKNNNWVNPSVSWKNKWKKGSISKEKFLGSSTLFVMFTDLWHLSKFLMIVSFCISIVFYTPIISIYLDILLFYLVFTLTFQLFFFKIWIWKK